MSGKSFMSRLGAGKTALSLIAEVRSAREELARIKAELATARELFETSRDRMNYYKEQWHEASRLCNAEAMKVKTARETARKGHADMRACDTTFAAVRVGIAALAKLEET